MDEKKEEEKRKTQLSLWLDDVDDKAEERGEFIKLVWQFIKFSAVSFVATIIQFALVNLMYFLMKGWTEPLPELLGNIFNEEIMGEGRSNWGYILPFFISSFVANSVGYFINRRRTFKSDAPWWHYVLYLVILFVFICVGTWIQGVVANWFIRIGWEWAAPTLGMMIAGSLQFMIMFPLHKFVLLREKKKPIEETTEETIAEEED